MAMDAMTELEAKVLVVVTPSAGTMDAAVIPTPEPVSVEVVDTPAAGNMLATPGAAASCVPSHSPLYEPNHLPVVAMD